VAKVGDREIENGAVAQFKATNLGNKTAYLYFVDVLPTGQLLVGPLLDPATVDVQGLEPRVSAVGHAFRFRGLPGSVTETRVFCSPEMIWDLFAPPLIGLKSLDGLPYEDELALNQSVLDDLQMQAVWYQIPEAPIPMPVNVQAILSVTADIGSGSIIAGGKR
jgi:hypothetical protein